ncbi:MAG TPA: Gmad2 immunoglobulin-like domain-containing protein [Anaerolineae bacterium]|nr:Gmad2 immunoglobulin-like domain-containing protein [Anaerolineae bacterium]
MTRAIRVISLFTMCAVIAACGPSAATPPPTASAPAPTVPPTVVVATPTLPPPTALPSVTTPPDATVTPATTPEGKPTPVARITLSEVAPSESTPGVIRISGKAQVFEAMLVVELHGPQDEIIAKGYARASIGAPEWGDFSVDLFYTPPASPTRAILQAYEPSPKDGSPNSLVTAPVRLVPAPELARWQPFDNATFGFSVRYPTDWHLNQGSIMPAPPAATKLSTYQAQTPGQLPAEKDAEVWITVSDVPSLAEMENLARMGYRQATVVVGGHPGVRYTAPQPVFGVYDVVYTLSGRREYRIQLSANTHQYDATFNLILATFSTREQ